MTPDTIALLQKAGAGAAPLLGIAIMYLVRELKAERDAHNTTRAQLSDLTATLLKKAGLLDA